MVALRSLEVVAFRGELPLVLNGSHSGASRMVTVVQRLPLLRGYIIGCCNLLKLTEKNLAI